MCTEWARLRSSRPHGRVPRARAGCRLDPHHPLPWRPRTSCRSGSRTCNAPDQLRSVRAEQRGLTVQVQVRMGQYLSDTSILIIIYVRTPPATSYKSQSQSQFIKDKPQSQSQFIKDTIPIWVGVAARARGVLHMLCHGGALHCTLMC